MNALTKAIEAATAVTIANTEARQVKGWQGERETMIVWAEMDKAQETELTTDNGDKVTVICREVAGECATHVRIRYKLNGKVAKAADVEAMFRSASPVVATIANRKRLGLLVGL